MTKRNIFDLKKSSYSPPQSSLRQEQETFKIPLCSEKMDWLKNFGKL